MRATTIHERRERLMRRPCSVTSLPTLEPSRRRSVSTVTTRHHEGEREDPSIPASRARSRRCGDLVSLSLRVFRFGCAGDSHSQTALLFLDGVSGRQPGASDKRRPGRGPGILGFLLGWLLVVTP
jgi:hypothetical protein